MSFWTSICRTSLALSVVAVGLFPQVARAAKPSKEELQTFKQLVKQGSQLRDDGQPWQALDKFEEARQILDHPKLAFNIGKLHQQTGACQKAKDAYTDVLARPKLPDDVRVEVVEQLKSADDCKPFATLSLECTPPNATVQVGENTLTCPLRRKVTPGAFELVVSANGYAEKTVNVTLEPGKLVEEKVALEEAQEQQVEAPPVADSGGETPWMTYAAYGSMGVGAALLVGGIASDYSAQSRAEEFVAANNSGDRQRAQTLKSEADSAQVRTVVLYSAGAVLLGGGVALWAIETQGEGDEAATVSTEVGWGSGGPAVRGVLRW
ncbi:PEGA domain-containing protein [Persicimonas caeni]|uniref:PEGA domain-containing protein n=1 Tax=Persicimonas caeni TaxID=2292766 RepID=A0A4Y6PQB9_PERCE|nr:PEGA domain-containing protein [Persicimonas caeni]QDG50413.1 PEGA domain-containing protein [Persicimonas caeni]QED31634.1 PEGA domain-containing protein [Persicimonas caeni]